MITRFKLKDINSGQTELFTIQQVSSMTYETKQVHLTSGRTIFTDEATLESIWNLMALIESAQPPLAPAGPVVTGAPGPAIPTAKAT